MNNLENYFYSSWLKKILWIKKHVNIINFVFEEKKHLFIIINLSLRQKSYISDNKDLFNLKLEKFLYLFNTENKNYKNIWMNRTEINNKLYWNTIILSNIKQNIKWYIPLKDLWLKYSKNWLLENFYILNSGNIPKKEKEITTSKKTGMYYDIIIHLLESKNFSVRKLREEWINTQKSLMINDYIKKLNIFEVDIYDNKKKIYFLERLVLIDEEVINNF